MKITLKALAPLALVAAFGLGNLAPHAQTPATKIGVVNVNALIASHPGGKELRTLEEARYKELTDLDSKIRAIDAKGSAATAAEKQQREQLVTTINAKSKSYSDQLVAKAAPIEKAVDTALGNYVKQNGIAIVIDSSSQAAQEAFVYADPTVDITEAVKKNIK